MRRLSVPRPGLSIALDRFPDRRDTIAQLDKENMTFQVDTFFQDKDFGLRWENGVRVTKTGASNDDHLGLFELPALFRLGRP